MKRIFRLRFKDAQQSECNVCIEIIGKADERIIDVEALRAWLDSWGCRLQGVEEILAEVSGK